MNLLVSVLIPAYNHEKFVQETIKSIINQTYQNIELIIIDDGSKDLTWQKINEMKDVCEKRFSRVIFKTQDNNGTCQTLNKLLDLANGEFIYIIASDDLAKSNAIETELEFLIKHPKYSLVVGNNEFIDSESKICYLDENKNPVYKKSEAKFLTFADMLLRPGFNIKNFGNYGTLYGGNYIPNGYLIRKSIFNKTGPFVNEAPLEDWWLMLQISKYSKLKYLDKILFSYRQHENNTVKNLDKMRSYINKTRYYETLLIKDISLKNVIDKTIPYGTLWLRKGIPYLCELQIYITIFKKTKIYKIFGVRIYKTEIKLEKNLFEIN